MPSNRAALRVNRVGYSQVQRLVRSTPWMEAGGYRAALSRLQR